MSIFKKLVCGIFQDTVRNPHMNNVLFSIRLFSMNISGNFYFIFYPCNEHKDPNVICYPVDFAPCQKQCISIIVILPNVSDERNRRVAGLLTGLGCNFMAASPTNEVYVFFSVAGVRFS